MPSMFASLPAAFAPDPWCIGDAAADPAPDARREALFAVGNGYLRLRGNHEDTHDCTSGQHPDTVCEPAADTRLMLQAPDAKAILLTIGGERFDLAAGEVTHYRRSLDFRSGVLERRLHWTAPSGRQVALRSRRLACFTHPHLFAIDYEVTPLNFSGSLWLTSTIDASSGNELAGSEQNDGFSAIAQRIEGCGVTLACAIDTDIAGAASATLQDGHKFGQAFAVSVRQSASVRLTKYGAYFSSREGGAEALMARTRRALTQAREAGFDALCARQRAYLDEFWSTADVAGDPARAQSVRLNQFQRLQSSGRIRLPSTERAT